MSERDTKAETNAWGERVTGNEHYPSAEALRDSEGGDLDTPEDPDGHTSQEVNSEHGGENYHNGAWPNLEK